MPDRGVYGAPRATSTPNRVSGAVVPGNSAAFPRQTGPFWIPGCWATNIDVSANTTLNRVTLTFFVITQPVQVWALMCTIKTAGTAGSKVVIGLLQCDSKYQPQRTICCSPEIAGDSTGSKVYQDIDVTIRPGVYALGLNHNAATSPLFSGMESLTPHVGFSGNSSINSNSLNTDVYITQTFGPIQPGPIAVSGGYSKHYDNVFMSWRVLT